MAEVKEVIGFVRAEQDVLQNVRSLKTIKSCWPEEVVLREKPMVECTEDSDVRRLAAFLKLPITKRQAVMAAFSDAEVTGRGCEVDAEGLSEVLAELAAEGLKVDKREAARILSRWRYGAHIDRLAVYEKAGTLRHSCAANVDARRAEGTSLMSVTARYTINPQARIGGWYLEDTSIWWKGADIRSAAIQESRLLDQECCCERCQGDDTCRAIKCPGCTDFHKRLKAAATLMLVCGNATLMASFVGWRRVVTGMMGLERGEVTRNGKLKRWRCTKCDFNASDSAVEGYVKIERALIDQLGDIGSIPSDQLRGWVSTVEERLGGNHWVCIALWKEIFRREVGPDGDRMSFTAVLATIRVCEWFLTRKLPKPPMEVIKEIEDMMFKSMEFLHSSLLGVRDLRVLYLRAIDMFRTLIESVDKAMLDRFKPFAGVAQNLRRRCGFCSKFLKERSEEEQVDISAEDFGGGPMQCAICKDLGYCDLGCQMSDQIRHRHFCIPTSMGFCSKHVERMLVVA